MAEWATGLWHSTGSEGQKGKAHGLESLPGLEHPSLPGGRLREPSEGMEQREHLGPATSPC